MNFTIDTDYKYDTLPKSTIEMFYEWLEAGKLGFMDLPGNKQLSTATQNLVSHRYLDSNFLIIAGIGGSSLGTKAILSALTPEIPSNTLRKVFVVDSPDSSLIADIKNVCIPEETFLAIVTKSGGTAETLAVFLELFPWLTETALSKTVVITDPNKGDMRKLADDREWDTLPIPESVGGRYSVLSPAALFPAAFSGVDIEEILTGASVIRTDFMKNGEDSLAARISAAYLENFHAYPIHVFMPYSDRLYDTAFWFSQLWAESLGKLNDFDGREVMSGQTPLACRGPAAQHSLVQLFMEGPLDKTVTIVTAAEDGTSSSQPLTGGFADYPGLSYLEGYTIDELRAAEAGATVSALRQRGIPVTHLTIPDISGHSLGMLFMAFEIATVLTGLTLGVNPLDQPGVEVGKILTYKAMNREGYR